MIEKQNSFRAFMERINRLIVPILMFGSIGATIFDIFVYSIAVPHFHWNFSAYTPVATYSRVIVLFLCVTILAWQEKGNFADFNLDNLTLFLLIIVGLLRMNLRVPGNIFYKIVIAALSLMLLAILYRYGEKLIKVNER